MASRSKRGTFPRMKRVLVSLALVAASYSAFGQADLIGTWKGKSQIDTSKMPKAKDAEQQKKINEFLAQLKKLSITLNLKKGGLYTVNIANAPGPQPNQSEEGTWKVQKDQLITTATKENGKAPRPNNKPQTLTIDKAHKHLTMVQGPFTMTFTK